MHLTTFACTWILFQVPKMMLFRPPNRLKSIPKRDLKRRCFSNHFWSAFWSHLGPLGAPSGSQNGMQNRARATLGSLGRILASTWRAPSGTMASLRLLGWLWVPSWLPSWALGLRLGPSGARFWTLQGLIRAHLAPIMASVQRQTLNHARLTAANFFLTAKLVLRRSAKYIIQIMIKKCILRQITVRPVLVAS